MRKIRQGMAVILVALMLVTMLSQNSMQTFASETAAVESPETVSGNGGNAGEQEDAAVRNENMGGDSADGNETGEEDVAGEDESAKEEDKDQDDVYGEEIAEEDDGEEAEDPEGISENAIDESVTLFGMGNGVQSTSSEADFVISNGVLTGYTGTATELVIPDTVTKIGNNFLKNNQTVTSVTFSTSVTSVGDEAFMGCTSLGSAELNEGLETIGRSAFSGARLGKKLNTGEIEGYSLTIPSTVQKIDAGAFQGCSGLREVIFTDGGTDVLTMGGTLSFNVFGNCERLEKVYLPVRLQTIPDYMLYHCNKLKVVYIPLSVTQIGNHAMIGCPRLVIYGMPGTEAERYAKANKIPFKSKTELNLSVESVSLNRSTITKAGEDAIGETVQLRATVLPNSVQNKSVTWTSSNLAVATVDGSGLVTISGYGKATITVTTKDGNKQTSCVVSVLRQWTQEELEQIKAALQTQNQNGWTVVTNQLADISDLKISVPNGAGYTAEWKLDYDVETGINDHYDIRIRQEGYQDAILRGFTVTGVTLEGLTVNAPNQDMKVETGKELTLTVEPEVNGLPDGVKATSLYKVEWKSATPSMVSVVKEEQASENSSAQTVIRGVKKASNITVTATLILLDQNGTPFSKEQNKKGKTWFETSVKISVLGQPVTD